MTNAAVIYDAATGKVIESIRRPKQEPILGWLNANNLPAAGQKALQGFFLEDIDGWIVNENDELQQIGVPDLPLQSLKLIAQKDIDRIAGEHRMRFASQGYGQEMTYLEKAAEAQQALDATNPSVTDYPLLSAEIGVTADDLASVASIVAEKAAAWKHAGALIEKERLKSKRAVDQASSKEEIDAVLAAIHWPHVSSV